ncbi:MAG: chloride channel protein [Clostridia bacterium]|nr:chloride channel protein [Clostridia bacterium]
MSEKKEIKIHLTSSVLPALLFGAVSGICAGTAVTLYKFFAKGAVGASSAFFTYLKQHWWAIPLAVIAVFAVARILARIYKKEPDLRGGGIPASVGTLRGLFRFHPGKTAVGSFFLSLVSFLLGVPLGTEGPSVQLSTALGAGVARCAPKKWRAWERFSMTGGASAGFSVATGAPLSGIFFAVEEAHGRISPLIVLTAVVAVLFAELCAQVLSPLLGVDVALFAVEDLKALSLAEYWKALVAGVGMGVFSVLFLKAYHLLDDLLRKRWRVPDWVKIFAVFCVTLAAGLASSEFISTGHHLIGEYFAHPFPPFLLLIAILLVRTVLTLSANISGITGGIFLPLLAIGSTAGAVLGKAFGGEMTPLFVIFGIVGCIAGMMKMPLTAILFGVEALGLSHNLLPLILVCILAYSIPEALGEESVGECVLERRKELLHKGKVLTEEEKTFTVEQGAFAVGKEVRDIFWPDGVRVLSVKKEEEGHLLGAGDVLLVRFSSYDREKTERELGHIVTKDR